MIDGFLPLTFVQRSQAATSFASRPSLSPPLTDRRSPSDDRETGYPTATSSCSTPRRRRAYPQELWSQLLDPFAGISFTSNNDLDEGDCWKTTATFVRLIASFEAAC